ncbi:MAG: DUF3011 domain-containing protein [Candidatus Acidiferrales bacterium]
MQNYQQPAWIALLVCFVMVAAPATAQTGSLNCASNDGRYHYCRADTQNNVRLVRQNSRSRCDYGYSWGYDYRGIWVDRGCRAQFEYGRGGNGGSNTGAAVAAGILGALIVGSAIANSKSNDDVAANRRDYYLDGYRHGQRDWDDDRRPDYQRYLDRFPREYENDFLAGYNDGYNNRPNKYR